jgi:hypothetical protein
MRGGVMVVARWGETSTSSWNAKPVGLSSMARNCFVSVNKKNRESEVVIAVECRTVPQFAGGIILCEFLLKPIRDLRDTYTASPFRFSH